MTAPKKPTVSSLQRKVERLTNQIREMHVAHQRMAESYFEQLQRSIDLETRNAQALRLLRGEDE